ncbi:MAG: ATP-dependent DNA helicase RecG [Bacilli bacterium]|nr:ATP-dependent DNA helicase RecG [Bacilli bacterium]
MDLKDIKGIGTKSISYLNKLNINNVDDLVNYYPFRYNILRPINILNCNDFNNAITINAKVISPVKLSFIRKNMNILSFDINSNKKIMKAVIFNRHFLKNNIKLNSDLTLTGKYDKLKNQFIVNDISFNVIKKETIIPVYHVIREVKQKNLHSYIMEALTTNYSYLDNIPLNLVNKYQFINKKEALNIIHNPQNIDDLKKARLRLIYEELFTFATKINYLKRMNKKDNGLKRVIDVDKLNEFMNNLPFLLTEDQNKAVNDILNDLTNGQRMNRLLMGDVGSGKTIVAIIALYINYLGGYQGTLMAPTEILAIQHYQNMLKVMPKDLNIKLIVGKLTKKEKLSIYEDLKNNKIDIIVGTHALLNDELSFNNLGLVITDEQHRFGVNARKCLINKGVKPDLLYTTATPIPRTYAMTIFGDMDTSIIKVKPGNRSEIKTQVIKEDDIKTVLIKVKEELELNHQVYVVAPSIENEEDDELNSVKLLKEKYLKAFPNKKIAILHGKLKNNEKDLIITDFMNKKIDILISTTVIEVGIDSDTASVMIIYNAERFGLSTLHQLRGRVGRSDIKSYCFLISDKKTERLTVLEESNDGFYISEMDFKIRREGDLFGTNQSGDMHFKIADLRTDFKILKQAIVDSNEALLNNDDVVNNIINSLKIIS